jgi:hypothetical protein
VSRELLRLSLFTSKWLGNIISSGLNNHWQKTTDGAPDNRTVVHSVSREQRDKTSWFPNPNPDALPMGTWALVHRYDFIETPCNTSRIRERLKNGIHRNVDARNLTLTKVKVRHITNSVKSLAIPTTWTSLVSHRAGWSLKHTKMILMLANSPNWNTMMSLAHGNLLTKYG